MFDDDWLICADCNKLKGSKSVTCSVGPLEDALGAGHVCWEDDGGVPVPSNIQTLGVLVHAIQPVPGGDESLGPYTVLQVHLQYMSGIYINQ